LGCSQGPPSKRLQKKPAFSAAKLACPGINVPISSCSNARDVPKRRVYSPDPVNLTLIPPQKPRIWIEKDNLHLAYRGNCPITMSCRMSLRAGSPYICVKRGKWNVPSVTRFPNGQSLRKCRSDYERIQ